MTEEKITLEFDYLENINILNSLIIPNVEVYTIASGLKVLIKKTLKKNVFIINDILCDFNKKKEFNDGYTYIVLVNQIIYITNYIESL